MQQDTTCENLLTALLEITEHAVVSITLDGTVRIWSNAAEQLYGYTAEEMTGQPFLRLLPLYEIPSFEEFLRNAPAMVPAAFETTERLHKNGTRIGISMKRVPVRNERGEITGILESACALHGNSYDNPAETQLRMLVEQMPVVLWTTDQNLRITSNWGSDSHLSRIQPEKLQGRTIFEFLKCNDEQAVPLRQHYEALRGSSTRLEYRRNGRIFDMRVEPMRATPGNVIGCIGVAFDITERKKTEENIRYQATHDALTDLANYREFVGALEREILRTARSNRTFAVMLLDLDDLKGINDRFGHLAGNQALKRLAQAMKKHCRETDVAARYGGDEFAVLLIDSDDGMAHHAEERIQNWLRKDEEKPQLSVSTGVAVYPEDGRTASELLEVADRRLYSRKNTPRAHRLQAAG